MGGGLELALGCHFRVASPGAKIALPEVKLGLLPGAGGTQRLPRAIGVEAALNMIVSGAPVSSEQFKGTRLIDEIIDGELLQGALAFARKVVAETQAAHAVARREDRLPGRRRVLSVCPEQRRPAGEKLSRAAQMHRCGCRGRDHAVRRRPQVRARAFHATGADAGVAGAAPCVFRRARGGEDPRRAREHAGAQDRERRRHRRGHHGRRYRDELSERRVSRHRPRDEAGGARQGRGDHTQELRGVGQARQAHCRRSSSRIWRCCKPTLSYDDVATADLVIEAVFEDMAVKQAVFEKLDAVAKPGAILATNTSTLDVNRIAAFTRRPQDVVGMHFFSPANVMKLLEVVRGQKTAKDVLVAVMQVAKKINKTAVVSGVCDGFIGNRMIEQYLRQAMFLLDEGASPQQVDRALERFGMAMGPFRMSDLAGNDVGWYIRKRRYVEKPNVVYSKIADRLCELGRFGQKTGLGLVPLRGGQARRHSRSGGRRDDRRLPQGAWHRAAQDRR